MILTAPAVISTGLNKNENFVYPCNMSCAIFICYCSHYFTFVQLQDIFITSIDAFNRSPSSAGHLTNIKYTVVQLGATAILGCCKDYAYVISWVLVIKGTFQCELEMNRVVDLKHRVKRVVKRLSHNVTEVELKGAEL